MLLPVGATGHDGRRWGEILMFGLGVFAGGAFTLSLAWMVSGLVRWMPGSISGGVLAGVCALVVLEVIGVLRIDLPQRRGMIPRSRFERSSQRGFFLFGLELGTGLRTYLPSPAPHLLLIFSLLTLSSPVAVGVTATGWALGRTAPLLSRSFGEGGRGSAVTAFDWPYFGVPWSLAASTIAVTGSVLMLGEWVGPTW